MNEERVDELLMAIQSKVNTLIGKSLVLPALRGANSELIQLGNDIDQLIWDWQNEMSEDSGEE